MSNSNSPTIQPQSRSHGRGGAGNINSKPSKDVEANDLQTPTIKGNHYTTGRGGTGNMARNNPTDPSESRAAQDVEAPAHHGREMQGTYHWGRGGEGNMTVVGKSERQASKERKSASKERIGLKERTLSGGAGGNGGGERKGSFRSAVERGKEMLGLRKEVKERGAEGNGESAIE
ncbi:hypothetical protein PRZ48_008512 [Zasmidium cellare]|uniref:Uncharacterized protein n=1 Tax=Zasmidium cellare TaxID=395010 RepID=A0ABR0EGS9_ZASCE|nr:hypothetical protein PRZ48_008512 [Zasmidium cellare]